MTHIPRFRDSIGISGEESPDQHLIEQRRGIDFGLGWGFAFVALRLFSFVIECLESFMALWMAGLIIVSWLGRSTVSGTHATVYLQILQIRGKLNSRKRQATSNKPKETESGGQANRF